jgi:hypothetical protein
MQAREEPLREVKDLPPRDETGSPLATSTFTGSPKSAAFSDTASKLPQWVENDRKVRRARRAFEAKRPALLKLTASPVCHVQVLRFYGFFQEGVVESNIENHRVRKVVLYYYLVRDRQQQGQAAGPSSCKAAVLAAPAGG